MKSTSIGILLLLLLMLGCNACSDAQPQTEQPANQVQVEGTWIASEGSYPLGRTGLVTDAIVTERAQDLWDVRLRIASGSTALLLSMRQDDDRYTIAPQEGEDEGYAIQFDTDPEAMVITIPQRIGEMRFLPVR